jgi:hypothetical protein
VRLVLVLALGHVLAAASAAAQAPGLSATTDAKHCAVPADLTLKEALPASSLEPGATSDGACMPATDVAAPVDADVAAAASAKAIVATALAEANQRVASLKFLIGPPPRNMTKGRNPAP